VHVRLWTSRTQRELNGPRIFLFVVCIFALKGRLSVLCAMTTEEEECCLGMSCPYGDINSKEAQSWIVFNCFNLFSVSGSEVGPRHCPRRPGLREQTLGPLADGCQHAIRRARLLQTYRLPLVKLWPVTIFHLLVWLKLEDSAEE